MCNCVKHTETSKTDTKPEVKVVHRQLYIIKVCIGLYDGNGKCQNKPENKKKHQQHFWHFCCRTCKGRQQVVKLNCCLSSFHRDWIRIGNRVVYGFYPCFVLGHLCICICKRNRFTWKYPALSILTLLNSQASTHLLCVLWSMCITFYSS